jgi:ABC-2 type transport system ATP-binding protein
MAMESHLEVIEVSKHFAQVQAVRNLSFAVPRGSIFGLLGPNGAGKTTTIRMIMRIALPDSGTILLSGQPIDDTLRERIGYLPEERGLYRKMRVLDQLVFIGEIRGLERREARRRACKWLERLGLDQRARARVEELSKGMQQKVQFAGTVIHEPEVIILDEPFTGLDPIATRLMKDEMTAMREHGKTVLLSTHVLPQAEELCDHICLINRGRSILGGSLAEVRGSFAHSSLRVATTASADQLAAVPGVVEVRPDAGSWLLELEPIAAVPTVIYELASRCPIESVQPASDSLETVFLRAVEADHGSVA